MISRVSKDVRIFMNHLLTLLGGSWLPIFTWIYEERIYMKKKHVALVTLANLKYFHVIPVGVFFLLNYIHCRFINMF